MKKRISVAAALSAALIASASQLAYAGELPTNLNGGDVVTGGSLLNPANGSGGADQLNATNSQVNRNTGGIAENKAGVGKNSAAIGDINKLENNTGKNNVVDGVLENRGHIGDLETRAGAVENRLDGHDAKIKQNEANISKNANAIAENKSDIQDNHQAINRNTGAIFDNAQQIEQNRNGIEQNAGDIANVNEKVETNTGNISLNANAISANSDAIDTNKATQDKWNTAADGKISANADGIAENKKGIEKNAGDIAAETERAQRGEQQAENNAKDYADGRVGDVGGAYLRDKEGNIVVKDGKAVRVADAQQPEGKSQKRAEAETPRASGKDYTDAQRAEAMAEANAKFDEVNRSIAESSGQALKTANAYADGVGQRTLDSANRYTDSRYNQLNGKLKKLRARSDAGTAAAVAIGTLTFDTLKPNAVSGGLSVAKNKVAGAVGYQRNFSEHWRARGTIAVSDAYVTGGTSVGYSW